MRLFKRLSALIFATVMIFSVFSESMVLNSAALNSSDVSVSVTNGNHKNNKLSSTYEKWSKINESYLIYNSDKTISKISLNGSKVVIDTFTDSFEYKSSKNISFELPIFGGFYSGPKYNYLFFGQKNLSEKNNVEVYRLVRYDKNWKKIDHISYAGENTREPFAFGGADMSEANGILYIHTCHVMYRIDGVDHQSNVQLHINVSGNKMTKKHTVTGMKSSDDYCSHSFTQFVRAEGNYAYILDHGDAYPRAVQIVKKDAVCKLYGTQKILNIAGGFGDNNTGVTVGGFEIAKNNLITVMNSSKQVNGANLNVRNILLCVTNKNMSSSKQIWLTNFSAANKVSTPRLLRVNDNSFIVLWNEFGSGNSVTLKAVRIDGAGSKLQEVSVAGVSLSQCQPILGGGNVLWFVDNGTSTSFVRMNASNLSSMPVGSASFSKGDVNKDRNVNSADALLVLQFSTGLASFNSEQKSLADMNSDNQINSIDALAILQKATGV